MISAILIDCLIPRSCMISVDPPLGQGQGKKFENQRSSLSAAGRRTRLTE
jgi:hypothetical protein